jgi:large subunit ribosomal protein L17
MHRHGYKGRKFNRETDQRSALIQGLADSLIKYESIETTLPKAKEVVPYLEKLITKAKIGDLHNRRQIISSLQTLESAHKLVDQLAPLLKGRDSGHLRITKTRLRRGDQAQLARVTFVDDLKQKLVVKPEVVKPLTTVKTTATPKATAKPKPKVAVTKTTTKKAVAK